MEENREISYIVRMLLTTIGSYGIIRVLTSCALFQVSDMAVIFGILAAAVICVYGLYGRKKHFLIVTGILFAGLSVLSFGILRAGFCHIYNDCMTALEKPYGLSLGRIAVKETAARPMQETIAVLFIAVVVTFAAAVIVIYLHSMLGTLLSILPLLILFVSLGAVPDSCTFFSVYQLRAWCFGFARAKRRGTAVTDGFVFMSDCTDGFGYCAPAGKL